MKCKYHKKCKYYDNCSETCEYNDGGNYCGEYRKLSKLPTNKLVGF